MQPLNGVKVLDLARLLPGSLVSLMLADFGAEVIMIEHPEGEPGRRMGPFINNLSARHLLLNRNKKSITLNLRADRGQELLRQLVKSADVLVENFRPGFMDGLGIGHSRLMEENRRLIFCSLTGYGQNGPLREKAGHDINFISMTGILGLGSQQGESLAFPGVQMADVGGSLMAVSGILLSLVARAGTGRGQYIDVSMADGLMNWLPPIIAGSLAGEGLPGPGEYACAGRLACYNTYRTEDGRYLALGALEPKFWERFCRWMGFEEFIDLQRDLSQQARIKAALQGKISKRTLAEWMADASGMDMCLTPVRTLEEALDDPQVAEREMIFNVDHPEAGTIRQIGFPIKLSMTPAAYKTGAPLLGEHNGEIYSSLGLGASDLEILRKQGVI